MRARLGARVALSFVARFSCDAVMLWAALWAEAQPASASLPDRVLNVVPYLPWVDTYNYVPWAVFYVPVSLTLMATRPERFIRYMYSACAISLLRAGCLLTTGLGPVHGADLHVNMDLATRQSSFLDLTLNLGLFNPSAGTHLTLTKDLFFSGHTSTTLLLLLYVWDSRRLRPIALVGHVVVVASLFLGHLHYTIDVIAAYAVVLAVFAYREGSLGVWEQPASTEAAEPPGHRLDAGR